MDVARDSGGNQFAESTAQWRGDHGVQRARFGIRWVRVESVAAPGGILEAPAAPAARPAGKTRLPLPSAGRHVAAAGGLPATPFAHPIAQRGRRGAADFALRREFNSSTQLLVAPAPVHPGLHRAQPSGREGPRAQR